MSYASIQMFMEKLNQLISCTHIPFINNNPTLISERPQFQLLYHDLAFMIQALGFTDQHQHLEKVNDLKKRFTDAAEEAQYIVDLFLSDALNRSQHVTTSFKSVLSLFLSWVHDDNNFNPSLNLDDLRSSFKSIQVEFMSIKMDSSVTTLSHSSPISISRNSKRSKKSSNETVVGLDRDIELIRDKLVEDKKKVDVVSIVGMGGIGKTTLATKVFNDAYVKHHFHVRVWVTVSQTYDKRAVLVQILESIGGQLHLENASVARLREMVHKSLMGKRYLIVIDDIWDTETWDKLKLFYPHDYMGSRILITSRITEVAKHANSDGFIHQLGCLNKERSWELLCEKVFHGIECPEWSIKPGMQIVENCQGLPLVVVVIAGVLAKEAWSRNLWMEIAERTGSYMVGEENGCLETLALSYDNLPIHLRECFLYVGGFPEDHTFHVRSLIWLWVAEGFIVEDGNRRLEDIAESYLMDLIDRNLVIVAEKRNYDGAVEACKVHDLVRELCLKKAREEQFIIETEMLIMSSNVITRPYKSVRKFINTYDSDLIHSSTRNIRSILCFSDFRSLSDEIARSFRSFVLLRVLDIQKCELRDFPKGMELLVHLRYLAISVSSLNFPSSICNLWNLQILIYNTSGSNVVLPSNISDLVNLRHLWSRNWPFVLKSIEKPMNLQTISRVRFKDEACNFRKYFPYIKELSCIVESNNLHYFKCFTHLERLSIWSVPVYGNDCITLPETLTTLTLAECRLPWSDMTIIQLLPNLQVLKLQSMAFVGSCWNTDGQEFQQLKFLRLMRLSIKQWEVCSTSFPCLRHLEISDCYNLEETPLEIGDIPTLELIKIRKCRPSVDESVRIIQQEQQDMGNYDLKVEVDPI